MTTIAAPDAAGAVLGVVGGSGGIGASSLAATLADVAGRSVLVDCDPLGGGIDVLLGIETVAGARWSGLRVDGGRLDPAALADGLPRWRDVSVLAADVAPSASALAQVIDAATQLGTVVLDLPRHADAVRVAALLRCELCVLVAGADVRGLAAARVVASDLPTARSGVVVRRGTVSVYEAARLVGLRLLGTVPGADHGTADEPSRATLRVASGVLDGLDGPRGAGA